MLVGLLLLRCFLILSCLSLTTFDFHGILHVTLGLIGMHSAADSKRAVTNFSYSLYGVCLSDVSKRVLNLFLAITVYWLLIFWQVTTNQILKLYSFVAYFCVGSSQYLLRRFCDWKILLQKRSMLHSSKHSLSTSCLYIYIKLCFWVIWFGVSP